MTDVQGLIGLVFVIIVGQIDKKRLFQPAACGHTCLPQCTLVLFFNRIEIIHFGRRIRSSANINNALTCQCTDHVSRHICGIGRIIGLFCAAVGVGQNILIYILLRRKRHGNAPNAFVYLFHFIQNAFPTGQARRVVLRSRHTHPVLVSALGHKPCRLIGTSSLSVNLTIFLRVEIHIAADTDRLNRSIIAAKRKCHLESGIRISRSIFTFQILCRGLGHGNARRVIYLFRYDARLRLKERNSSKGWKCQTVQCNHSSKH